MYDQALIAGLLHNSTNCSMSRHALSPCSRNREVQLPVADMQNAQVTGLSCATLCRLDHLLDMWLLEAGVCARDWHHCVILGKGMWSGKHAELSSRQGLYDTYTIDTVSSVARSIEFPSCCTIMSYRLVVYSFEPKDWTKLIIRS
jgi:hypothetical protein